MHTLGLKSAPQWRKYIHGLLPDLPELVNKSNYYTNIEERNLFLTIDKSNLRIQKEWEKVK